MNNIFITAGYKKREYYGNLINDLNIYVKAHDNKEDMIEYEEDIEFTYKMKIEKDISIVDPYIYLLVAYIRNNQYGDFIDEKNINFSYYNSEYIAIQNGIKTMKNGFKRDLETLYEDSDYFLDDDVVDFIKDQNYCKFTFDIIKIKTDRHCFESKEDQLKYYKENLCNKKSKNELYDFLLDLMGGYQITSYNMAGKPYFTTVIDDYRSYDVLCMKSLLGYHVEKFNEGDIVKIKNDPYFYKNPKTFKIIHKYNKDCSIYESDDPLHFREGYQLAYNNDEGLIYNDYYHELYFDEDLELVVD